MSPSGVFPRLECPRLECFLEPEALSVPVWSVSLETGPSRGRVPGSQRTFQTRLVLVPGGTGTLRTDSGAPAPHKDQPPTIFLVGARTVIHIPGRDVTPKIVRAKNREKLPKRSLQRFSLNMELNLRLLSFETLHRRRKPFLYLRFFGNDTLRHRYIQVPDDYPGRFGVGVLHGGRRRTGSQVSGSPFFVL